MIVTPSPSTAGARIRRGWRLNQKEVQLNMTGGQLNQVIGTYKARGLLAAGLHLGN